MQKHFEWVEGRQCCEHFCGFAGQCAMEFSHGNHSVPGRKAASASSSALPGYWDLWDHTPKTRRQPQSLQFWGEAGLSDTLLCRGALGAGAARSSRLFFLRHHPFCAASFTRGVISDWASADLGQGPASRLGSSVPGPAQGVQGRQSSRQPPTRACRACVGTPGTHRGLLCDTHRSPALLPARPTPSRVTARRETGEYPVQERKY